MLNVSYANNNNNNNTLIDFAYSMITIIQIL